MKSLLKRIQIFLALFFLIFYANTLITAPQTDPAFPVAKPESQGISSAALDSVAKIVKGYFDKEEIVGAELLVIKNRHTVLHETFGWKDREEKIPMSKNTVFNIRSMTKPITGAGIQILIDEGKLNLDDKAADYLPGFKNESTKNIIIDQLLTHRSGLPLTFLKDITDIDKYPDLITLANKIGEAGTDFEPGSKFWYSDAGTDVLGAITEIVGEMPLDQFRRQKILNPLGMKNTFTLSKQDSSRKGEVACLYVGSIGKWQKFWTPNDSPFYPFAWGSQTLYSTPMDYAKFLAMWMDNGKVGEQKILSRRAIWRSLKPISRMKLLGSDGIYPTGFPHHQVYYGQTAMVYIDTQAADTTQPVIIGHGGSDGTYSWAWPDLDLMVLYFTQSRGGASGIKLEKDIYRFLINPDEKLAKVEIPDELKPYLGKYTSSIGTFTNVEFTVLMQNGKLAVDIPGQMIFELTEPDEKGMRYFVITNLVGVTFDKDKTGKITALKIHQTTPIQRTAEQPDSLFQNIPEKYLPYVGKYLLGPIRKEIFVKVADEKLAIDFVEQGMPKLTDPNENGRWYFEGDSAASVTFTKDDSDKVTTMNLLQVITIPKGKCAACLVEKIIKESGVEEAIQKYKEIKAEKADEYVLHERGLNAVGYNLLRSDKIEEAIEVFKFNVEEYPDAFNVYDSLGEAYMKHGDKELAIQNYKKSLELNPKNENAKRKLEELEKEN